MICTRPFVRSLISAALARMSVIHCEPSGVTVAILRVAAFADTLNVATAIIKKSLFIILSIGFAQA